MIELALGLQEPGWGSRESDSMSLHHVLIGVLVCVLGVTPAVAADPAPRVISVNASFGDGLAGWHASGDVHLQKGGSTSGGDLVRIGPGAGSISQTIQIGARNHMELTAIFHSEPAGLGRVTLRFLDKNGKELMQLQSDTDMKPAKAGKLTDYFRPHPLTASVELILSKNATPGYISAEELQLAVYNDDDPALKSTQSTADLMQPFWKGDSINGEAVLMYSTGDGPALGTLMFRPSRIISVTSYDGSVRYEAGRDYTVAGRTLIRSANSRMTQVREADLLKGEIAWNVIGGKQVLVSYEHDDKWAGPVQAYVGDQLPNTIAKLRDHEPLKIVAYGDSITYGIGSSHMRKIPPYQLPWVDLFVQQLKASYADPSITLYNASQSGADSNWAREMAARMVGTLDPDLVLIAFGQNDFWSVSADTFASNISSVIQAVRSVDPNAEFLLISTMRFDPAYSSNASYWEHVSEYDSALRRMTAPGVQLVDMTDISGAVFAAKEPKDCMNDPLHPDDYLSRWYAQSVTAALVRESQASADAVRGNGNN